MRQRAGTVGRTASSRDSHRDRVARYTILQCCRRTMRGRLHAEPTVPEPIAHPRPFARAGITNSVRRLSDRDGCSKVRRGLRLGDDLIAVHRVNGGIAVSVKYNGRNGASNPARCSRKIGPTLPHGCEGRRYGRCWDVGNRTQNDVRLMVCWTAQAGFRSTHNAALRKSI
jgi:hypothetical protein